MVAFQKMTLKNTVIIQNLTKSCRTIHNEIFLIVLHSPEHHIEVTKHKVKRAGCKPSSLFVEYHFFHISLRMTKVTPQLYYWIYLHLHQRSTPTIPGMLQIKTSLIKASVCTNYGTSTFKFSATKIWESVPLEFKCSPYMLFKKQYKRFLLSTQN